MPATRSFTRVQSQSTPVTSEHDPDVIIISSDEEVVSSTSDSLKKAQQEIRSLKKKLLARESSNTQILSDQRNKSAENLPSARPKKAEEEKLGLQKQLQKAIADIQNLQSALSLEKQARAQDLRLQEKRAEQAEMELASLRVVNQELHEELTTLTAETNMSRNGNTALRDLENLILCEVCIEKLWNPYTLSGCGHTFCQSCLVDWFNAAITTNPSSPQYTCPTCRALVHHKPVEDYMLKGIVYAISLAVDPASTSPSTPQSNSGLCPWNRFFR